VIGQIIRREIGFSGLLLSDDLDMEALAGTVPERASRAIAAGCDIALNCWARMADMEGIAQALPAISARAAERLEAALAGPAIVPDMKLQADLLATRDRLLAVADAPAGMNA